MRAAVLTQRDTREVTVTDFDNPAAAADEAVMAVSGATLNRVDVYLKEDGRGVKTKLPQVMGLDGIGKIVTVPLHSGLEEGDRVALFPVSFCGKCIYCLLGEEPLCISGIVAGENRNGTFAEYIAMPSKCFVKISDDLTTEVAAAGLSVSYMTAYRMIFGKHPLSPGETILLQGIGGGVACACLQLALLAGAKVIVTSSDNRKIKEALKLGAIYGFNYQTEDISRSIINVTNGVGVDRAIDSSGLKSWDSTLRSVRRGGKIFVCGATTGGSPPADLQRVFIRQLQIIGSSLCNLYEFKQLIKLLSDKLFVPIIDTVYELDDVNIGLEKLSRSQQFGKLVIIPKSI